jgi:hypothetical protein
MIGNRLHHIRTRRCGLDVIARPRRLPLLLSFVLLFMVVAPVGDAAAYRGWCRADPQFLIGGDLVLIRVSAQTDNLKIAKSLSTGPIIVIVRVPPGTHAEYLASSNGFGDGFDVSIDYSHELKMTTGAIPVEVDILVPMSDSSVAIRTEFTPAGSAAQARADTGGGESIGRGRDNGVLIPGSATGFANQWITMAS